jgi:hypothetical protein
VDFARLSQKGQADCGRMVRSKAVRLGRTSPEKLLHLPVGPYHL